MLKQIFIERNKFKETDKNPTLIQLLTLHGSSHQRCSVRKGVLRNSAKFTEKQLCQSLFFNKVAALGPTTLSKKETLAQVFSGEFCGIS